MSTVFWISYAVIWALVLILIGAVVLAYQHMAAVFVRSARGRREQGPEIGTFMRATAGRSIDGRAVQVGGQTSVFQLLYFIAANCKPCQKTLPEISAFAEQANAAVRTVAICEGSGTAVSRIAEQLPKSVAIIPDPHGAWHKHFGVLSAPFAIMIDETGRIRAKGKAPTAEKIRMLFEIAAEGDQSAVRTDREPVNATPHDAMATTTIRR